jgi:phenylpropionate dioxygenase-like ring-hydroxylating dioxygenase large terminal subunit
VCAQPLRRYHGWQFNGEGSCTRIPQIRDEDKMKAACASPRACVSSYPTTVVEGMLFAWLESGPEAEREAAAQQPYIMPEQVWLGGISSEREWGCSGCCVCSLGGLSWS